ncbi:MAG TPA: DNA repair ATPase, partial [Bacteroidia bacterium]|nr:DNA repair ATPase [Bacteroidia bacterium]
MAETANTPADSSPQLEGGTYEIIRNRMLTHGAELRTRLGKLNASRKDVFGAIEFALTGSDRISTENNCTPRDIAAIGNKTLFGYNVHIGLRTETKLGDVFSLYLYKDKHFVSEPLDFLSDPRFLEDFKNMFKYYRETVFVRFATIGIHLFMVFKIGKAETDIKVYKWIIQQDDTLKYIDNRSEAELRFPDQHEFKWVRTHREMHRKGKNPHISILDRIFVETIGGNLTIKVEDNTDTGQGIYEEDVTHKEQSLDDAEIFYANLGNIIVLKIRPFQEKDYRYIAYNHKVQEAKRIDSLGNSCVLLPDDHGIIFPNGYYLQTGEFKLFDYSVAEMQFEKRILSPNGEDYLYTFLNPRLGNYILLSYNIISQQVETPIFCHGYCLFEDGEMCYFKAEDEPKKHHAIQIWQTPYTGADFVSTVQNDNYLFKIGNKDIVRAMAQCQEVLTLLNKSDSYANLYVDLVKLTGDITDAYFFLGKAEAFKVDEPLREIRKSAEGAIQEFEKVIRVRKHTRTESERVQTGVGQLIRDIKRTVFENVNQYVAMLAGLRTWRGEVTTLKELRYVDETMVAALEKEISDENTRLSQGCVEFLLRDDSLKPYAEKIVSLRSEITKVKTATEAAAVEQNIEAVGKELELLIEIVSNLKIEDATQTTRIIDQISNIYAELNQVRAALRRQRKELMGTEAVAEFASQLKLVE